MNPQRCGNPGTNVAPVIPYRSRKRGSSEAPPYRSQSASAASSSETASIAASCRRAVASRVISPARDRSSSEVASASFGVELAHMRWPAVPASQTAPVRRSSTVTPSWPGSVRDQAWPRRPGAAGAGSPSCRSPASGLGVGFGPGAAPVRAEPARFAGHRGRARVGRGRCRVRSAAAGQRDRADRAGQHQHDQQRHQQRAARRIGRVLAVHRPGEATRRPGGRPRAAAPAGPSPPPATGRTRSGAGR